MSANSVLQHLPHHNIDLAVAVVRIVIRRINLTAVMTACQVCWQLRLGAAAARWSLLAWAAAEQRLPTTCCALTSSSVHLLEAW
jgi:hypothetical protein